MKHMAGRKESSLVFCLLLDVNKNTHASSSLVDGFFLLWLIIGIPMNFSKFRFFPLELKHLKVSIFMV